MNKSDSLRLRGDNRYAKLMATMMLAAYDSLLEPLSVRVTDEGAVRFAEGIHFRSAVDWCTDEKVVNFYSREMGINRERIEKKIIQILRLRRAAIDELKRIGPDSVKSRLSNRRKYKFGEEEGVCGLFRFEAAKARLNESIKHSLNN